MQLPHVRWIAVALGICAVGPAQAESLMVGDYGSAGLWQTPTARLGKDGDFAVGIVRNEPYNRFFFSLQALPRVEVAFRYTDVTNRLYSEVESFSGNQSYKDRSFDLRFLLVEESRNWPALALGARDFGGTQLFGSQYLVANRGWQNFDFSLGLGFGRLGSGGPISNPFARAISQTDQGGDFSLGSLFASEDIGLFGGLRWQAPIRGLEAVVEYDANDFKNEPLDNTQVVRSPVNIGLRYRTRGGVQMGLSFQRGETLNFNLALLTNFGAASGFPKVLDPAPTPTSAARIQPTKTADPEAASLAAAVIGQSESGRTIPVAPVADFDAAALKAAFKAQRIGLSEYRISPDGLTADLVIGGGNYRETQKTLGRAARAAAAALPESVVSMRLTESVAGLPLYTAKVPRKAVEEVQSGRITLAEFYPKLSIEAPDVPAEGMVSLRTPGPSAGWSINPGFRSQIGGPEGFLIGQLFVKVGGFVQLSEGLSVNADIAQSIVDNFDRLRVESDSVLPHVRSDVVQYLKEGRTSLQKLEVNYLHQIAPTFYGRVSGGIFEEMYGGAAAELLWRPEDPRYAVGVNINRVRQRDFDQRFSFRDYEVTTGNVTAYFEIPNPSVLVRLSAGQYLAGDRGGTIDISREFGNGIRVGAFATKTNVSAEDFGEGSFDKGFYFIFPFDLLLPSSNRSVGTFGFRPLTRDGGQMVRDGRSLYDATRDAVTVRLPKSRTAFID